MASVCPLAASSRWLTLSDAARSSSGGQVSLFLTLLTCGCDPAVQNTQVLGQEHPQRLAEGTGCRGHLCGVPAAAPTGGWPGRGIRLGLPGSQNRSALTAAPPVAASRADASTAASSNTRHGPRAGAGLLHLPYALTFF